METKVKEELDAKESQQKKLFDVKRRISALKTLHFKKLEVNGKIDKEILKLETFRHEFDQIYKRRADIINGNVEPTEEEWKTYWRKSDSITESKKSSEKLISRGIPYFWFRALFNCIGKCQIISKKDRLVLLHLKDIVVKISCEPTKLILEFKFEANEYFTNEVLTKEYELEHKPNPNYLWDKNLWSVIRRKGSDIHWKDGKNLTEKRDKKSMDDLEKSFFYFFDPPEDPKDKTKISQLDTDLEGDLIVDWHLSLKIAQDLVPNALLFYIAEIERIQNNLKRIQSKKHF